MNCFSKFRIPILALLIFFKVSSAFSNSLNDDSLRSSIQQSIQKAVILNIAANKCSEILVMLSTIFITFTAEGTIDSIIFSESPDCLHRVRDSVSEKIKKSIDRLNFDRSLFENAYILSVVTITFEGTQKNENLFPDSTNLFKGIDEGVFVNKNLKYCLPINIHLSRIRN